MESLESIVAHDLKRRIFFFNQEHKTWVLSGRKQTQVAYMGQALVPTQSVGTRKIYTIPADTKDSLSAGYIVSN
jgi:hypothetical protein